MGKRYLFPLCLALGILLFLSGPTEARKYRYTDLGTFAGQQTQEDEGEAWGLNDKGQIVGWARVGGKAVAVRWDTETKTFITLGAGIDSCALSINNLGWIVGTVSISDAPAVFFWDPAFPTPALLPNTLGGTKSWCNKINDQGQVVGYAESSITDPVNVHAFLSDWTNRTMQNLGTLGGTESWANDINSLGQIVGASRIDTEIMRACWDAGSRELQSLGTLGGGENDESAAMGINNRSQVVGWSTAPDGYVYAFLRNMLAPGEPMQTLGILAGDYNYSQALGINDRGEVVGECGYMNEEGILGSRGAFIWTAARGMQDLNTLVGNLPAGRFLACAYAINRSGWIVGVATDSQGLHQRAFLLQPIADLAHLQLLLLD